MKCNKCGYEIKEGNLFCTNCDEEIDVNKNVKNKGKIKIRVWHIIVLFIVIISIIIGTILLKQKEKINTELEFENTYQQELSNNNEQILEERNEIANEEVNVKVEIGKKYIRSNEYGYIIFNKDNTIEIQIGDTATEYYTLKGTYKTNTDTIDVHIDYDSAYLITSVDEEDKLDPIFEEYDTVIKILKDGELEYTNEYNQKSIFKLDEEKNNDEQNEKKESVKRDLIELDNKVFNFTEKELSKYFENNESYSYMKGNYKIEITEETLDNRDIVKYTTETSNGAKRIGISIDRTTNKVISFSLICYADVNLSSSEREKEKKIQFDKGVEALYYLANGKKYKDLSKEEKEEYNKNFKKPILNNEYNYYLKCNVEEEELSEKTIGLSIEGASVQISTQFEVLEAPDLQGRTLEKAIEICKSLGLGYEIKYIETSDPIQKGIVYSQSNRTVVYGGVKGRKKNQVESIKIILTKEYEER